MIIAIVLLACLVVVVAAVKLSEHMKHPENITPTEGEADPGSSGHAQSSGNDRPAGADAEDPPTVLPNRADLPPGVADGPPPPSP